MSSGQNDQNGQQLSTRKSDHIDLAFQAQMAGVERDPRFYYEPLLKAHPTARSLDDLSVKILGKNLKAPLWISSMTGGAKEARKINENLAHAAAEFGLGMGLGSCRILLDEQNKKHLGDFQWRSVLGPDLPFYANLGLAQVEQALREGWVDKIHYLVKELLVADGLIIHINPLQEWLQPEGDRFQNPPLTTLEHFLSVTPYNVIVKEVGQGIGPSSLRAMLQLPLTAVEFSAFGGTNFSQVELLRGNSQRRKNLSDLIYIGHTAEEMVNFTRELLQELGTKALCREFIISGGIKSFLDGHYLMNKLGYPCIYGQGRPFLEYSRSSYEELQSYVRDQIEGLMFSKNFLQVRE